MSRKLPDDYSYRDRHIAIGELRPHPTLQRSFVQSHAENIFSNLDPAILGLIWVQEKNGKFYVIDGQHRLAAVTKWLNGDKRPELLCRVFANLSDEQAAVITNRVNVTRRWNPIPTFLNRVKAKDDTALTIQRALSAFGLEVSQTRGQNVVQAVSACEKTFLRLGETDFQLTIGILHGAWGGNPDAYSGSIVEGLGLLLNRHNGQTDVPHLTKALAKSGSPEQLIGTARYATQLGYTLSHAMAHSITVLYNKGRRGPGKLPDWKKSAD